MTPNGAEQEAHVVRVTSPYKQQTKSVTSKTGNECKDPRDPGNKDMIIGKHLDYSLSTKGDAATDEDAAKSGLCPKRS